MSLPATDNFTGTDGDLINGRVTTTGSLTWASNGMTISGNTCWVTTSGNHAILNSGVADMKVSAKIVVNNPDFWGIVFRSNSGFTQYLVVFITTTNVYIYDESGSPVTSGGGSFAVNDTIEVDANGASITVLQNGSSVLTYSTSHGQTNTYAGLKGNSGSPQWDNFSVDAVSVVTPTAAISSSSPTAIVLVGTSGSGGTPPYTYQWQRSLVPASGYSNLSNGGGVSGATTLTLTDGSALSGTVYYYQLVVTDSLSATFTSNVQSGTLWKKPAYTLFIGDSVTVGFGATTDPVTQFAIEAKGAAGGQRSVITYNAGLSGTATGDWYDSTGSGAKTLLINAVTNGVAAGCTEAHIMLGANDAFGGVSNAVFRANLAGIASYCLANGIPLVFISYTIGFMYQPSGGGALALSLSYHADIDAVCNGTTILKCDTLGAQLFQDQDTTLLQTQGTAVHPNNTGCQVLGGLWAYGRSKALGELGPIGQVSGMRSIGTY